MWWSCALCESKGFFAVKVTKEMLHEDLRPYFNRAKLVPIIARNKWLTQLLNKLLNRAVSGKDHDDLDCSETYIQSSDGNTEIRARIYQPLNHEGRLPVMLYLHGGGLLFGNPEMNIEIFRRFIQTRPCVIVSPDYRKSYTQPYPAAFNDCYDTLLWIKANADMLEASADKIIVAGHSAGGGLTAAVTLKARDTRDVNIAFQMPIYPMLDDLQPGDPERYIDCPMWNSECSRVAWNAYLADLHKQNAEIPAYAAPARNSDYRDFPPTITFVGSLEPLVQETVAYVERLRQANVEVAFKEYEGCLHNFEGLARGTALSEDADNFLYTTNYADFYDRYASAPSN